MRVRLISIIESLQHVTDGSCLVVISSYSHRKLRSHVLEAANIQQGISKPASIDVLRQHCLEVHTAEFCNKLAGMTDEQVQKQKNLVVREEAKSTREKQKLERAQANGEVIVVD